MALIPDRETIRARLEEYARRLAEELGVAVDEVKALVARFVLPRAYREYRIPEYGEVRGFVEQVLGRRVLKETA